MMSSNWFVKQPNTKINIDSKIPITVGIGTKCTPMKVWSVNVPMYEASNVFKY